MKNPIEIGGDSRMPSSIIRPFMSPLLPSVSAATTPKIYTEVGVIFMDVNLMFVSDTVITSWE